MEKSGCFTPTVPIFNRTILFHLQRAGGESCSKELISPVLAVPLSISCKIQSAGELED